jgi:hypothetical protein
MFSSARTVPRTGNTTNITTKLTSRAVSGDKLNIAIHQHYARDFHLAWRVASTNEKTTLERYFFEEKDYTKLCEELARSPIEGVCGCLYNINADLPPGIEPCNMRVPIVFEEDMSRERVHYLQTRNWSQWRWVKI